MGNDGTDQTPRNRTCGSVSPCSSEPQQRLRQRWGEQRKREGEALKETAAAAQGAAGDKGQGRVGSPLGEEGGLGLPDQLGGGSEPSAGGLILFPTSILQMPTISSAANASQHLSLSGLLGSQFRDVPPAERKRIPWRE